MMRREREVTDLAEIKAMLDKAKVIHLGLCDGDQPYVVPMNYGYTLEDGTLTFYLHGALQGYKYDVMRKNPKISFSIETDVAPFEGEVACQYGTCYSCVMGRGTISILTDSEERKSAMRILMKTQTGKDFTFTDRLLSAVTMMRMDISEFTAKRRPLPAALRKRSSRNSRKNIAEGRLSTERQITQQRSKKLALRTEAPALILFIPFRFSSALYTPKSTPD